MSKKEKSKYFLLMDSLLFLSLISLVIFKADANLNILFELFAVSFMGIHLLSLILNKVDLIYINKYYLFSIIIFFMYSFLSSFYSLNQSSAFSYLVYIINGVLYALFVIDYVSRYKKIEEFLKMIVKVGVLSSIYCLLFLFEGFETRLGDNTIGSNGLAYNLIFPLISIVLLQHQKRLSFISITSILLMLFTILLTGSRQGILFSVLGMVLLYILLNRKKLKTYFFSVSLFSLLYISLLKIPIFYNLIGWRLESLWRNDETNMESSYSTRAEMIEVGMNSWKENPIWGTGFYSFGQLWENTSAFNVFTYAHNNYIEIAVGLGIVGLILFYFPHSIILSNFLLMLNKKNLNRLGCFFLVVIFILLMGDISNVSLKSQFQYIFVGLAINYFAYYQKNKTAELH